MRIIAGEFRDRRLTVPRGEHIRPTTDRVREASFDLLMSRFEVRGISVLDLFAGTGALGLEALSRGAKHATFVESNPLARRCCRENVHSLGVVDVSSILQMDVSSFLDRAAPDSFKLILADPPYRMDGLVELVSGILRILAPQGYFVLEHDRRIDFSAHASLVASRRYGRTVVSVFSKETRDE